MAHVQQTAATRFVGTGDRLSILHRVTGQPLISPWRWAVAAAAITGAAAHVPVVGPHLDEAPYMGALFIVLTAACLALAAAAPLSDGPVVYGLAVLTCGLAIVGYAATRLVAFPQLADDVGDWFEPLGVVSIIAEATVVIASVRALAGAGSVLADRSGR